MEIAFIPPDPNFAERFYEWRQDAETKMYNPLAASTVEELRERLAKAGFDFSNCLNEQSMMWFLSDGPDLVGSIGLNQINKMMLTAEVGYTIAPHSRNRGIATVSLMSLANKVFLETPLRKLIAYVHEDNLPSKRVLERVGFRAEGFLREHYLVGGKPANELIYGFLRKDWASEL